MIEIPVLGEITPEEFEIIKKANEIEVREKMKLYGDNPSVATAIQIHRQNFELMAARTVKR